MVPKVAGKGRNFVGAGLYYLHDKKALTRERVAFTHTENLPTRDPDKAIKCMAWTALRQQQLKTRSGGSAKGRKLEQPVYCYSLSWAPGEEPSQEDMIGAAKESLKQLGLADHEALFVGHNDEPHPHIHVIVNRVHPETGIAAPLKKDFLKLSTWAEKFEKSQGQIRCGQRVENNALRAQGEFIKDRDSQTPAEFYRWQQKRADRQTDKRAVENAVLEARHERERDQLRIARDKRIEEKRLRVREATRADWRDLFSIQRQERGRLETAQRNAWTRVRHFISTHREEFKSAGKTKRRQMIKDAFGAFFGSKSQFAELERKQKNDRIYFAHKLKARTNELIKPIRQEYDKRLTAIRARQNAESQAMRAQHSEQSKQEARDIRSGRDREVFRREQLEQRRRDLEETKKDILKAPPRKEPRPSLKERFAKASRTETKEAGRGASGGKGSAGKEAKQTPGAKSEDRTSEFPDQTRDVTDKRETPDKAQSLSAKFKRARDTKPVEQQNSQFRENAEDQTRDAGRERTRTPKPPGGKKPT